MLSRFSVVKYIDTTLCVKSITITISYNDFIEKHSFHKILLKFKNEKFNIHVHEVEFPYTNEVLA